MVFLIDRLKHYFNCNFRNRHVYDLTKMTLDEWEIIKCKYCGWPELAKYDGESIRFVDSDF